MNIIPITTKDNLSKEQVEYLQRFTDSFQAGHQIPFTDLVKVEK